MFHRRYREATLCSHLEVQRGHIVFSAGGTERPHCVLSWRYREATLCSHLEVYREATLCSHLEVYREATLCSHLEVQRGHLEVQRGHIVFSSGGTGRPHCVLIWRYREATLIVPSAGGTERPPLLEALRGHLCWRH